jgi:excisionase family DNA binding protein
MSDRWIPRLESEPPEHHISEDGARLLEAEDVARYLGMRTDWVYREARAGRLPHVRLGRAVRFRRESLEAWVASQEARAMRRRRP